jgi:hypothetical protein
VQDDLLERRILIVAMRPPTGILQIYLHISGDRRRSPELQYSPAEIRAALDTGKTRMKHPQGLPVQGLELIPLQTLLLPDGLEEPFRRPVLGFMQSGRRTMTGPPTSVWVGSSTMHLELLLRQPSRKVKRRCE